jgi:hypothetical protein
MTDHYWKDLEFQSFDLRFDEERHSRRGQPQ